jgi:hypothetical protein
LVGGKAGALWARGKSAVGSSETFNRQRLVEMFNKNMVLKKTETMKGVLSDNDIKFLVASVPGLTDTEETWLNFLGQYEKTMLAAKQNAQLLAAGTMLGQIPDVVAPPGYQPDPAIAAEVAASAAEPGVFSDEDLRVGRLVPDPTRNGKVALEVNGVKKPISSRDVFRLMALQAKGRVAAKAAPAPAAATDSLPAMLQRAPVLPAASGYNREAFGQARGQGLATPSGYDREAFGRARIQGLTGVTP